MHIREKGKTLYFHVEHEIFLIYIVVKLKLNGKNGIQGLKKIIKKKPFLLTTVPALVVSSIICLLSASVVTHHSLDITAHEPFYFVSSDSNNLERDHCTH